MARLFTDGAEMRDASFWDGLSVAGIVTIVNTLPYISPYYYYLYYAGGASSCWRLFSAALSEGYARARIMVGIDSLTSLNTWLMALMLGSTKVAWVGFDGAGRLTANVTTVGVVGSSAGALAADTWYLLEVYFKEANAPNGRFVVKVDSNIVIDYTGDTQPAAASTFDNMLFQAQGGAGGSKYVAIDDLAYNDTTGAADNSYCDDGIVVKVTPDGNGTHNNWHGSDGDDVNNYLLCQEYPKDDDATYNYHDNTPATQQQFAMSHLSFTGYTIRRLYAEARAKKTAAIAMTLKLGQLAAGGADVVSAGRALYTGGYFRVVGDDSKVNPVDGNPWEEADIDAIEFVAQVG